MPSAVLHQSRMWLRQIVPLTSVQDVVARLRFVTTLRSVLIQVLPLT
ncbi:hypothetical protein FACS1894116_10160 [Betaproteobacteria bacterium]|nr:hypothetical protein FACS1894116_10160 [Betaproteobacteria bacterium]GHU00006.1 hypothetical protein FACS1894154_08270 [Betaproteobacteria bacterium]GHU25989.1 hypothetical protein FACS189488_13900 [Betaproteobacteria bacterium]